MLFKKAVLLISIATLLFPAGTAAAEREDRIKARTLTAAPYQPLPRQIGNAAIFMAESAEPEIKKLSITPVFHGIKGHTINILRDDIDNAVKDNHGSAEEIWRNVTFENPPKKNWPENVDNETDTKPSFLPALDIRFILDNKISLDTDDSGISYRTSLLAEARKHLIRNIMIGSDWRLNISDNLQTRAPVNIGAARRNVKDFTHSTVGADRLFISWLGNIGKDTTASITAGYLEEMYGGFGGEILYRPFKKTFAIGAEGYRAYKRDPDGGLNSSFTGDNVTTAFLNIWYEIPRTDMTVYGKIGRYLAEDIGGTLELQKRMDNGIYAAAFITGTDKKDVNASGSTSHFYGGVRLHVPLNKLTGKKNILPAGSEIRMALEPQNRDAGQSLALPVSLYDITEPLSYRHLGRHWPSLLHD